MVHHLRWEHHLFFRLASETPPSPVFPQSISEMLLGVIVRVRGMLERLVGDFVLNMLDRIVLDLLVAVRYEELLGQSLFLVKV